MVRLHRSRPELICEENVPTQWYPSGVGTTGPPGFSSLVALLWSVAWVADVGRNDDH